MAATAVMAVMARIRSLRIAAFALALAGWPMPASAAAATILMSPADDRGGDTLNPFASHTIAGADNAVFHDYAGDGLVEGADFGVLSQPLAFNVAAGNQLPLALNIAPLFIQGLIDDGAVGHAGIVLRSATPGGDPVSVHAEDWGDTSVHPSLAIEFRAIPEPASLFLLGAGLMAVGLRLRRRVPRA